MRRNDERMTMTLRLYLRLCSILAPTFLIASAIGLFFMTEYIVDSAEQRMTARVGAAAERMASGLERLSAVATGAGTMEKHVAKELAAEELAQVLMADPAVMCVEISNGGDSPAMLQIPHGVECEAAQHDAQLTLPIAFREGSHLIVRTSLEEINAVRSTQQRLSALILFAGLMIALATNWITFRLIIGKPLLDMVRQIDDARRTAERTAMHDSLTGVGNRRYLNEIIDARLEILRTRGEPFSILQLDLDHFKDINDTLGHGAGDAMLRHVAKILKAAVRPEDFVARTGGDEFVILVFGDASHADLSALATRLIRKVSTPLVYHAHSCAVATSIGICRVVAEELMEDAIGDHILSNADFALYRAKASGRGKYLFFEEGMRSEVEAGKFLANDFERGVKDAEIVCFYQPQYDVQAGKVLSVEALVRWKHPLLGIQNPAEFLPLADKLALTTAVDEKILQFALADLARWDQIGLGIEAVSVNLTATRLEDPNLLETLRAMNIPRDRFTFEILETAFVDDLSDVVRWNLDGLRELGIEIELDDFGTGKASVLGVIEMAPHRIKVARELIASLGNGEQGISFVRAIAAIGHSLGVGMVAEGVEEAEHCRIAAELGFQRLQGYHISRPLPRDEFEQWMTQGDFKLSA